ncbi:MAG: DUF2147 domain-containing protein [Burkholderiales bacterium]|jgi:uncharacterized protein (DUF2147 family)|nr:DUF2147 domain-containing protein [Burkholderiales bacterium]
MKSFVTALAVLLFTATRAFAAGDTPVGVWKTIDDKTGQPRSLVRIVDAGGKLEGTIEKLLNRQPDDDPDGLCRACKGELKDKPVLGMKIMKGFVRDGDAWVDGEILDPKNGKVYSCKLKLADGGKKLDVRGFIGLSIIGRTQTWVREE